MAVVRFMLKVVLLPVLFMVKLAEWIGIFLTSFASVLFYLFAGLSLILAVFSYLAGISTGPEALRMLAIGFIAFLLPHLAAWVIGGISVLRDALGAFFRK